MRRFKIATVEIKVINCYLEKEWNKYGDEETSQEASITICTLGKQQERYGLEQYELPCYMKKKLSVQIRYYVCDRRLEICRNTALA